MTKIAKKYDLDTEVIYADQPCPPVDFKGNAFKLVEAVAAHGGDVVRINHLGKHRAFPEKTAGKGSEALGDHCGF